MKSWKRMDIKVLDSASILKQQQSLNLPHQRGYFAMYSSWLKGITKDPAWMTVPIDDHMVHRGDGVFEAFKCVGGGIYGLTPHLERLERSAQTIGLSLPNTRAEIEEIVLATVHHSQARDCLIRLYCSRGPGSFGPSPQDCISSQLYVVATSLSPPPEKKYIEGASMAISSLTPKEPFYARVKSCNYLPNVLQKMEALQRGVDFCVPFDSDGFLTEGPTENAAIVSSDGFLLVPSFDRVLRGVTMLRAMQLVTRVDTLRGARESRVSLHDVQHAREILMFGTTLDVLPVTHFNGNPVQDGKPGPAFQQLRKVIADDIASGDFSTRVQYDQ